MTTGQPYLWCAHNGPEAVYTLAPRDLRLQVLGGVLVPVRQNGSVAQQQKDDGNEKRPRGFGSDGQGQQWGQAEHARRHGTGVWDKNLRLHVRWWPPQHSAAPLAITLARHAAMPLPKVATEKVCGSHSLTFARRAAHS